MTVTTHRATGERRWVIALCVAAIVLGLFFRLHGLSRPVPFEDEAMTWLRISGFSEAQLNARLYDGQVHTAGEIAAFQRHNREHGVGATLRAVAVDDPHHSPLYFVLQRLWSGAAGDTLTARRLSSALAGIGLIAAFAWLCAELFGGMIAPLIGGALAALSPLHIVYAQQGREYELWALLICLSSAALVAAARQPTQRRLLLYTCLLALTLYTHLFSLALVGAHLLWILLRFRSERRTAALLAVCAGIAVLAYAPWLVNLALRHENALDQSTWSATAWPLKYIAQKWAFNLSATFFDLLFVSLRYAAIGIAVLALVLFAFVDLRRWAPADSVAFVVLLALVSIGALLLPDLLLHEHRSTMARYVFPAFIALELALTGTLAGRITTSKAVRPRAAWSAVLGIVLFLGAWSAWVRSTHTSWWENNKDAALPAIARVLNATPGSMLLAADGTTILDLVNLLNADVRIRMLDARTGKLLTSVAPGTFVLTPGPNVRAQVKALPAHLEPVVDDTANAPATLHTFRTSLNHESGNHAATEATPGVSLWRIIF